MTEDVTLDAAWAAVEAALPEGWLAGMEFLPAAAENHYFSWAEGPLGKYDTNAATPAAALQELARLLKESKP